MAKSRIIRNPEKESRNIQEISENDHVNNRVERFSLFMANFALWAMLCVTLTEILLREVFHLAIGIADELGGYLLVSLTFMSLSICHSGKVFHQVEFVLSKLTTRRRMSFNLIYDILSFGATVVLTYYCSRFMVRSMKSGEISQNGLNIPIWIPQLGMIIGLFFLGWALMHSSIILAKKLIEQNSNGS